MYLYMCITNRCAKIPHCAYSRGSGSMPPAENF